jgi:hypothetical protein
MKLRPVVRPANFRTTDLTPAPPEDISVIGHRFRFEGHTLPRIPERVKRGGGNIWIVNGE